MFLINLNQWKCACVGINNWVILVRARYKSKHRRTKLSPSFWITLYSRSAFQRISSYQGSRSRDRLLQLATRFVTFRTWARTLIVLHVVPGFLRSCCVFPHDVVVHQSLSSKQGEAPRTTQHTAYHVFCCLLQPMSDSVLKHLIPHHRPCSKQNDVHGHLSITNFTGCFFFLN